LLDIWISEADMPLYQVRNHDPTGNRLAKLRGLTKQDAVRLAVEAELSRAREAIPLRERFAALRNAHPLPVATERLRTRHSSTSFPAISDDLRRRIGAARYYYRRSGRRRLSDLLEADQVRLCSARTHVSRFLDAADFKFVTIGEREFEVPTDAYAQFGKGRHPARLNMGDCYAYACASIHDAKLLFKGNDFGKTDVVRAG
jgi:uncharacterized protein with PIN domain